MNRFILPLALFAFPALAAAASPSPSPQPSATAAPAAATPVPLPSASAAAPYDPASATPAPFLPSLPAGSSLPSVPTAATPPPAAGEIRLNFQNASLADVLSYLSSAAGFIILQEGPVSGTVNVVSSQPVTPDEAVDLLNAVLVDKGYVAIRSGRILKIVARQDAEKRDLPVMTGSDPVQIPRKDNLVTQILPVRYVEVAKLIDNLRPLLPTTATISSNDNSNAIILTDTQTDIHRIAEIIRALDTSISGISTIKVYPLKFADSKSLADLLTQLFASDSSANKLATAIGQVFPGFGGPRGGNRGAGAPASSEPDSEARQAASRVVAVADEQSNSVIVSAPDSVIPTITQVIDQLDTNSSDITETRIFTLQHADANELATVLTSIYTDTDSSSTSNQQRNNNQPPRFNFPGQPQQNNNNASQRSERALLQAHVAVVADARTNSVLVSASHDTMTQVALTIGRLDASDAKKQHVHVYALSHADPDNVATILRSMFSIESTGSSSSISQPSTSRLENRTTQGATSDITNTLNTNSNSGTSR